MCGFFFLKRISFIALTQKSVVRPNFINTISKKQNLLRHHSFLISIRSATTTTTQICSKWCVVTYGPTDKKLPGPFFSALCVNFFIISYVSLVLYQLSCLNFMLCLIYVFTNQISFDVMYQTKTKEKKRTWHEQISSSQIQAERNKYIYIYINTAMYSIRVKVIILSKMNRNDLQQHAKWMNVCVCESVYIESTLPSQFTYSNKCRKSN